MGGMSIRCPSNTRLPTALPLALAVAAVPAPAGAVRLEARGETSPAAGVVVRQYRTSNPATNAWAAFVDLCAARISVEATEAPDGLRSTGGWGGDAGVVLATNGDFYRTGPVHVYGLAVGDGVAWPRNQTGVDPAYDGEWFFRDFGFIAFGHDWVDFSHTKWVKNNVPEAQAGWFPGEVVDTAPPGVISLVSGFPELVTEGRAMQCDDPTSDQCFRDRSDMRARHPRTAMGLTEDRRTFILLVVDGRTGSSTGMYGTELADTMAQLGAWQAFNLDGGGSSQLWVRGEGYLNDVDGNNSGSGTRSVANHWGVKVAGNPDRPAHCVSQAPCGVIPAEGGVVDDGGACFHAFGPAQFWREETGAAAGAAEGGGLHWTNAYSGSLPDNWAWWQLHFAEAGRYRVEARGHADFGLFDRVTYEILADGAVTTVRVDQSAADAWIPLGELDFAAGGRQHVRINDNAAGDVPAGRHIAADALRLVRLDGAPVPEPETDAGGSGVDARGAADAATDARAGADTDAATAADVAPGAGDASTGGDAAPGDPNSGGGGGTAGPVRDATGGPGRPAIDAGPGAGADGAAASGLVPVERGVRHDGACAVGGRVVGGGLGFLWPWALAPFVARRRRGRGRGVFRARVWARAWLGALGVWPVACVDLDPLPFERDFGAAAGGGQTDANLPARSDAAGGTPGRVDAATGGVSPPVSDARSGPGPGDDGGPGPAPDARGVQGDVGFEPPVGGCESVALETCNGEDDDCNGRVDDGPAAEPQPCFEGESLTGECRLGTRRCEDGAPGACTGQTLPIAERCNALDDDCNGVIDDGLAAEPCYEGPGGTSGVGRCVGGMRRCSGGVMTACEGQVLPADETCNGLDDDCNGAVDDGAGDCGCTPGDTRGCYDGPPGTQGTGICRGGTQTCDPGSRTWGACVGQRTPEPEVCNGADDDCNTRVDDALPGEGNECIGFTGACPVPGVFRCDPLAREIACLFEAASVAPEVCNHRDDDCDGLVDEELGLARICEVGVGACHRAGFTVCAPDGGLRCDVEAGPPAPEACNGLDDDCDGRVDEDGCHLYVLYAGQNRWQGFDMGGPDGPYGQGRQVESAMALYNTPQIVLWAEGGHVYLTNWLSIDPGPPVWRNHYTAADLGLVDLVDQRVIASWTVPDHWDAPGRDTVDCRPQETFHAFVQQPWGGTIRRISYCADWDVGYRIDLAGIDDLEIDTLDVEDVTWFLYNRRPEVPTTDCPAGSPLQTAFSVSDPPQVWSSGWNWGLPLCSSREQLRPFADLPIMQLPGAPEVTRVAAWEYLHMPDDVFPSGLYVFMAN
jgi:hypothetical protein